MARIVIKESEIIKYVRSLIREGRKPIIFQPKLNNGTFNMQQAETESGGKEWVKKFFKSKGLDRPQNYKWNLPDYIIDYETGEWINRDEVMAIRAACMKKSAKIHSYNTNERKKANKGKIASDNQITKDVVAQITQTDASDDDIENVGNGSKSKKEYVHPTDDYSKKWLDMSDEERAEARDAILNARQERRTADNVNYQNMMRERPFSSGASTEDRLRDRITFLKDKQAALGKHTDINDKKWREYDYLIKDTKKILNKYYGGSNRNKNDDEYADEVVKNALGTDLSSLDDFKDTDLNVIKPNQAPKYSEDDDKPLDDDDNGRSKYMRDYNDLKGFYGLDDDDDNGRSKYMRDYNDLKGFYGLDDDDFDKYFS